MARELRYSRRALLADYARTIGGAVVSFGVAILIPQTAFAFWSLVLVGALFVAFGLFTGLKQLAVVELDETGVGRRLIGPTGHRFGAKRIEFGALDRLRLRYFGGRRDRGRGIFELSVRARHTQLTFDHALEGFDDLVSAAVAAARRRNLSLDQATIANLEALGIDWPPGD